VNEVQTTRVVAPNAGLAKSILEISGTHVNQCYQCGKCGAGCPVAYAMDYPPSQLIHAIRLGLDEMVLNSRTIWLCASCETCTTRCPQEVDVAKAMDAAKIIAVEKSIKPAVSSVRSFHEAAIGNIRRFGRMWEAGMIVSLKLRTGDYTKDVELGKRMLRKGKLKLVPTFTGSRRMGRIFSRVKQVEKELSRQS
jgi:heterodisulfide reductase subunit C